MKITPLSQARRFIQDESGVYTVMGGLLALPILALIFVSLESAGIIQDQARLSDSLEQAVLSLTAENNSGRKENDYKLSGSNKENESFDINSEVGKRDNQMVTTFVQAFLPQTNDAKMKLTPVCTTKTDTNKKGHTSSSEVTCTVSGTIEHKSWFPLKVGSLQVIPQQVDVASKSRAFKKNTFNIPIDLMVVADLSGSMNYDLSNTKEIRGSSTSKLGILKEVLSELAEKTLLSDEANMNNRIFVTPFAMGAEIDRNSCAIPYQWDQQKRSQYFPNIKNKLNSHNFGGLLGRAKTVHDLIYILDTKKTLETIGQSTTYDLTYSKGDYCLKNMKYSTQSWYDRSQRGNFANYVKSLQADGATLASSGLLVAANRMLNEGSRTKKLGEQTKRVILVLSDGNDEILKGETKGVPFVNYSRITNNLIYGRQEDFLANPKKIFVHGSNNKVQIDSYLQEQLTYKNVANGMCNIIREKLNSLNNDKNTKIVFVEFGYASKSKDAWEHCVEGTKNYYSATDKESLLKSFKQAIGETDDVGRSIN
ncbi:pilus assembly protein [Actinobacillus pleuropneumoniae]|uniref:pilus assembly protein n=1 Tax=Actinobacillus pleuropneumoniae TaxID=715 RepID=UPI001F248B7A|nr:pilus assembly protein [Actinobacillus pleuropneumoniae]UKH38694.1 pilus assembly protein [Actinobacillus pleuropneumoniae]UQZ26226.1 pilus assembly protein [Actinobacillus pleuropneumoniae]